MDNNELYEMDLKKSNILTYDFEIPFTNDLLFALVMENKKILVPILEDVIGKEIKQIEYVEGQRTLESVHIDNINYSRFDVLIRISDGYVDMEVQKTWCSNQVRKGKILQFFDRL